MWQFVTLLIITFLINILAIIILKPIVEYILGKYPLYSVLSIHISIFETLLFCFLTIIIILVLINIYMKKLSNKI